MVKDWKQRSCAGLYKLHALLIRLEVADLPEDRS